jgi:hypothetical protein
MKNNRKKPARKSTLILGELVEITNPREQAEIDRRFRAAERAVEGDRVIARKAKSRKRS